jgi:protease IV
MTQKSGFKNLVVTLLAIIGSLAVVAVFVVVVILLYSVVTKDRVPSKTILELDLERGLVEYIPDDPVASAVMGNVPVVRDIVDALERAREDDRVLGLVARLGTGELTMGHAQEVRDAVIAFRESGKPAVAFSETFGELTPGFGHYYLATAFDSLYLQPSGDLGLVAIAAENPFFKNLLEKIDVIPQLDHRHEYKTAMNLFTEERLTEPHREATEKVLNSMYRQGVRAIAEFRGIGEDEAEHLIEGGPYIAHEALAHGLIDGIAYRDEVYDRLREQLGGNPRFLYLEQYLARAGRPHRRGETIALIYGTGTVVRGKSGFDPVFFSTSMGSETVTRAFRDAVSDKKTRAIIFRIDSPGGSYVASDAIWREVVRAQEKGIPVIASMSSVAGSGGYFVAMPAEKIVAQPATITGSIGVVGGKMVLRDLYERFGITWDIIATGESATTWSTLTEFTPSQWERIQVWLDRVYDDFTAKAAEGRGMTQEELHGIAKGRIWSGEDALELGLIDALGGFGKAIELAREAADIDPDKDIRIRLYPPRRSFLEMIMSDEPESSQPAAVAAYVEVMKSVQPVLQTLRRLGAGQNVDILKMPEMEFK